MFEEGKIIEINGSSIKVEVNRSLVCGSCHACTKVDDGFFVIRANSNISGLKVGQKVKIELPDATLLKGTLLLYGLPILGLLAGAIIGNAISKSLNLDLIVQEILPVVFGFLMLGITFLFIGYRSKKRQKHFRAKIVKVIHSE